jgi:hypothetical protein
MSGLIMLGETYKGDEQQEGDDICGMGKVCLSLRAGTRTRLIELWNESVKQIAIYGMHPSTVSKVLERAIR